MDGAFNSDDCRVFAKALDYAWEIFLKSGRLTSGNHDIARAALTLAIFESAGNERNPRRLAIAAVARMGKYEHSLKAQRALHLGRHAS